MIEYVTDTRIYERVLLDAIPDATKFVWLATSDLKDLHVSVGRRMLPFLHTVSALVGRGVSVRLLHAKEPGPAFREDFDRYPDLIGGLERVLCPRVHFKAVVVDGQFAYTGSANLTGAGMGAKSENRRNFESGIVTTDSGMIKAIMDQFDAVWIGAHCEKCGRKRYCTEYDDMR